MGGHDDTAYGEGGIDALYGGDNPTDLRETLWGGSNSLQDYFYDREGSDWDRFCGSDAEDLADFGDGDPRDIFRSGSNPYGHSDRFIGYGPDPGDEFFRGTLCS